jgi:hypothetical protein
MAGRSLVEQVGMGPRSGKLQLTIVKCISRVSQGRQLMNNRIPAAWAGWRSM